MAIKKKPRYERKAQPQNNGGRPTLYRGEYDQQLIDHMAEGGTVTGFAGKLGVGVKTVYEWAQLHEGFAHAVETGRAKLELWFEGLFSRLAVGQLPARVKSRTTNKDGSVTETFEYPTGSTEAAKWMSQNMLHWRSKKDVALTGEGGGPVKYTDLTETELNRIIKEGLEILGVTDDAPKK